MTEFKIPNEIDEAVKTLEKRGFEAYIVGGCVRDMIRDRDPKDWDITTNARPEEIEALFEKTFYNNKFGTVSVVRDNAPPTLRTIEITPFRVETGYSDKRHPDTVAFAQTVEEDLSRRDFTMNAIAYSVSKGQIVDPHKGQRDIKDKLVRAVGNPVGRISEDALRMLRAVRLAADLGFSIEEKTRVAIRENAPNLSHISAERIRDEFSKLLMTDRPKEGIELLRELDLLAEFLPELLEGVGIEQNQAHSFTVWEHNLRSLEHAVRRKWAFHVRLAALLHDIGKPRTRAWGEKKRDWTFYGHDVVGGKMARNILKRLRFPADLVNQVSLLVRYHLFFSDIDVITMSAVRRVVRNVGKENIWDLMKVRACDRIGTGRPKEAPYRLRKYEAMIEEALRQPVTVGMLKIDGNTVLHETGLEPGPKIGQILHALLEEVLDDPEKNEPGYLVSRATELAKLPDEELRSIGEKGKEKRESLEEEEVGEIRKRHWVK